MLHRFNRLTNQFLRKAHVAELVRGGVWYRHDGGHDYATVCNNCCNDDLPMFRKFLIDMHKQGRIYIRRDKPNYPLTIEAEFIADDLIEFFRK